MAAVIAGSGAAGGGRRPGVWGRWGRPRQLLFLRTLYHGVRFAEVAEAIYEQGRVDGRREVFEAVEEARARPELKNRNPGRPAKRTTSKAAAKKRMTKKAAAKKAAAKKAAAKKRA